MSDRGQINSKHSDQHAVRLARVGLSAVLEPRDFTGHVILEALGPVAAWQVISGARGVSGSEHQKLEHTVRDIGASFPALSGSAAARTTERWAVRAAAVDPERVWEQAMRRGLWLCTPEDADWPATLRDLGRTEPVCLWGRGDRRRLRHVVGSSVAIVGSRDCSAYGRAVTFDIAGGLASRGWNILSGGAYGVDAVAHQAALAMCAGSLPTVAVMAGGVDRLYPRGNQELLHQIVEEGVVISESLPGTMPARFRFLDRNRLIAALGVATVVTESRWRSGAQSTAHHAADLSRPVAAVPGSVHSAMSAGCHRLIRESTAVLATDVDDVLSLIAPLDAGRVSSEVEAVAGQQTAIFDGLGEEDRRLAEALPVVRGATVDSVARVAGLPVRQVLGGLRRLERVGLAVDRGGVWLRTRAH
ncbi:MAG: DNA-processing protein DprA [Kocuria sp.]|nr:DNA-processing protein DprA [Kocuria sp.]